jgi:hypothetical protein
VAGRVGVCSPSISSGPHALIAMTVAGAYGGEDGMLAIELLPPVSAGYYRQGSSDPQVRSFHLSLSASHLWSGENAIAVLRPIKGDSLEGFFHASLVPACPTCAPAASPAPIITGRFRFTTRTPK